METKKPSKPEYNLNATHLAWWKLEGKFSSADDSASGHLRDGRGYEIVRKDNSYSVSVEGSEPGLFTKVVLGKEQHDPLSFTVIRCDESSQYGFSSSANSTNMDISGAEGALSEIAEDMLQLKAPDYYVKEQLLGLSDLRQS